jgi:hypothetical protein
MPAKKFSKKVAKCGGCPSEVPPAPVPPMPGPDSTCGSCSHIPFGVNTMMAIMAVVILLLSVTVLTSVMVISSQTFQIEAFNSHGSLIDAVVKR